MPEVPPREVRCDVGRCAGHFRYSDLKEAAGAEGLWGLNIAQERYEGRQGVPEFEKSGSVQDQIGL